MTKLIYVGCFEGLLILAAAVIDPKWLSDNAAWIAPVFLVVMFITLVWEKRSWVRENILWRLKARPSAFTLKANVSTPQQNATQSASRFHPEEQSRILTALHAIEDFLTGAKIAVSKEPPWAVSATGQLTPSIKAAKEQICEISTSLAEIEAKYSKRVEQVWPAFEWPIMQSILHYDERLTELEDWASRMPRDALTAQALVLPKQLVHDALREVRTAINEADLTAERLRDQIGKMDG